MPFKQTPRKVVFKIKMNVVSPGASFTVKFIGRDGVEDLGNGTLLNKNTNVSTTLTLDSNLTYYDSDYYLEADISETVAEGEFFTVTLTNSQGEVTYIGDVFCTAQSDYSINDGQYTSNSTTNEYITR